MDSKIAVTLIIIGAVVGLGMLAYNADDLYLSKRDNVVVSMPQRVISGEETQMMVAATDSEGNPLENEEVTIYLETTDQTQKLYQGKTDSDGMVEPSFSVPDYEGYANLVVEMGDEKVYQNITVIDADSSGFSTKILITTDKPIYQPDQIIHIRTLTFEGADLKASESSIEIEITDPDGNKIFRKDFLPDEFGIASMDYALSDQLPLGNYKIRASVGNKSQEKSILVEKYVLPKFKIDLLDTKSWYTVDEEISGKVSANYFFGQTVSGTTSVSVKLWLGEFVEMGVRTGSLDSGEFEFSFSPMEYAVGLDINKGNGLLEMNVTVTDTGGHFENEVHYISIAREPIQITTLADTNVQGAESTYYIIARYPSGEPVSEASVAITIGSETSDTTTDSRGVAQFTFLYQNQDSMVIKVTKGSESTQKNVDITEAFGIKVMSDESLYEIGENGKFTVHYSGDAATNIAYYDITSQGFVITTGRLNLQRGKADFELTMTPDMSPSATVRVYKIEKDMDVVSDNLLILVSEPEALGVSITTDKDTYRPNEEVKLEFYISDTNGPSYSAIGISGVDLSVFEISGRFTGFTEVFWGLEEEFQTPQYQILSYVYDPTPSALPIETQESVSRGGDEIGILSSWPQAEEDAKNVKTQWIDNFWGGLALALILGYFGLFALAIKHKAALVIAVFIAVLLSFTIAVVLLYDSNVTVTTQKAQDGALDGGGDWDGEGDEVKGGDFDRGRVVPMGPDMDGDIVPAEGDDDFQEFNVPGSATSSPPTHIRTYFPETWYWNPSLITDENGYAFVTLTTPDTMTSWGIDAIASTKNGQIGTGETEVTVFQEFFVEPDIPVSVIRNDEFPLKVLVYNYENQTSQITVELQQDSWFELLSSTNTLNVWVGPNSVSSVDFLIQATEVGEHDVTINASSLALEDKVVREIKVDPDGKRVDSVSNGQLDDNDSVSVEITLDSRRVEGSENAYVKLSGGMEAVTLDGAETYIRFVSGCGEQSMSTLAIDILAFDTVQQMDGTHEKLFEYETIVNQGIQHELTFLKVAKNEIGRGIVWFDSDEDVHPWLTSWGLITFQDAKSAGFLVDDAIITDMQDWLVSQQDTDGSFKFPDWGIYETNNPILKAKKVATTAYITRALLYSGYSPTSSAVTSALSYLGTHYTEQWEDPYTLSLVLIALEDAEGDSTQRNSIASRLEELKKEDNGSVYWTSDNNMISDGDEWSYYSYNSHTIETTGYAIMALSKHGGYSNTVKDAVRYLLENRNGLGGFFSTQDTVVAFQALSSMGDVDIEEMTITVEINGHGADSIEFTDETKDITHLIDLRPYLTQSTTVTLTSSGSGSVIYQVYFSQHIPWDIIGANDPQDMTLNVSYDTTTISVDDQIMATVSLEYHGGAAKLKMVLIDLRAPVGFSFVSEDFEDLQELGTIDNYEINDREVMVYIQDIYPNQMLTFTYHLVANMPVKGVVQGIHAFDMYNPDLDVEVGPVEMISM
jgi:hypothetical protein